MRAMHSQQPLPGLVKTELSYLPALVSIPLSIPHPVPSPMDKGGCSIFGCLVHTPDEYDSALFLVLEDSRLRVYIADGKPLR